MKSIIAFIFLFFCFFAAIFRGHAQQDYCVKPFSIEAKSHYGFIMPHRTGFKNLVKGHVPGLEINIDKPTFGYKKWHHFYNYPSWGVSWYYAWLSNPEQLGFATGVYPYFSFKIIDKKKFSFNYKIGWGLGYFSKPFHITDNYKNIVIGSRLNAIIGTSVEAGWKISQRISWKAGLSFTHLSNGSYKKPNLGINIPSVNTGVSVTLGNVYQNCLKDTMQVRKGKYDIVLWGGGFVKENYPPGGEKFPAFTASLNFTKIFSQKHKLSAAYDVFYNASHLDRHPYDTMGVENSLQIVQYGTGLFYEIVVSRMSILIGMGGYLHSKLTSDGIFYHRIGTRYQLSKRVVLNLSLKTHWAKADHAEFGVGYKLFRR